MRERRCAGAAGRATRDRFSSDDDRRLAVRADLPGRLERAVAVRCTPAAASSCRPGRRGSPARPRSRRPCSDVAAAEAALDRLDLELALADVLEVLGRAEQHVDQRAEERRDRAEQGREPTSGGLAIRRRASLQHPGDRREPEEDARQRRPTLHGSDHAVEWKKSCIPPKSSQSHSTLPSSQPAANASPTIEGEQEGREDEDAESLHGPADIVRFLADGRKLGKQVERAGHKDRAVVALELPRRARAPPRGSSTASTRAKCGAACAAQLGGGQRARRSPSASRQARRRPPRARAASRRRSCPRGSTRRP